MQKTKLLRVLIMIGFILPSVTHTSRSENYLADRPRVVLKGNSALISVDMLGGSIVDFHFLDMNLNPFTWNHPEEKDLSFRDMGHLICFDRWGAPTKQELENGMPYHGEATHVEWQVLSQPALNNGSIKAEMMCELPMGGLQLKRTMELRENAPITMVREEITNIAKLGRIYNIIQHPTISPPFLDETVLVDTNAGKGFMQESPMPNPEEPAIYWPHVAYKGDIADIRRLEDNPRPSLVTYVFSEDEEYGWVTACNPGQKLLVGYIWKLTDYPWLSFWRFVKDGKPKARGLEFGTSGLHKPYPTLVEKGTILDRPLYEYIDAGETITKSYTLFMAKLPQDYKGVSKIDYKDNVITLHEHDSDRTRNITLEIK
ncbi:hypothetical protein ACFL47_05605 [Candidatus Latescibacterota bacterium]